MFLGFFQQREDVPCCALLQEKLHPSQGGEGRAFPWLPSTSPHSLTAVHTMFECPLPPFTYPGSPLPFLCFHLTNEETEAQGRSAPFLASELHFRIGGSRCHDGVPMTSLHSFCLLAEPERDGLGTLLGFLGCFNEIGVCLTTGQCVFFGGEGGYS